MGFRGEVENVSANKKPGPPSCFLIGPKNTNLAEDVEILLPVKFLWILFSCFREVKNVKVYAWRRWILFSSFKGKVENVSADHMSGQSSCFSDMPENTNLVEDVKILLPVKFYSITISGFRGKVENVSNNQRQWLPSCFSDRSEKQKLSRGRCMRSSFLSILVAFCQRFQRSRKCLGQSETRAAILYFRSAQNHKLGRGRWNLVSCQVSLNSIPQFQRRNRKCASLRPPLAQVI